jgi:hypothetical protein
MAFFITTTVHIQAPPAIVWEILVDFPQYNAWNPFIQSVEGVAVANTKLAVKIVPPGQSGMTFKPVLKVVKPQQELRWLGRLLWGGLFDGEHSFVLQAQPDGSTVLIHSEHFRGILVPFFKKSLQTNTLQGFENMNQALKARAEAQVLLAH